MNPLSLPLIIVFLIDLEYCRLDHPIIYHWGQEFWIYYLFEVEMSINLTVLVIFLLISK